MKTFPVAVDSGAVSCLLSRGAIVFVAAHEPDELIAIHPFAGTCRSAHISWPGIRAVAIHGGRIVVLDAASLHIFDDLHLRVIAGTFGETAVPHNVLLHLAKSFPATAVDVYSLEVGGNLLIVGESGWEPSTELVAELSVGATKKTIDFIAVGEAGRNHASFGRSRKIGKLNVSAVPLFQLEPSFVAGTDDTQNGFDGSCLQPNREPTGDVFGARFEFSTLAIVERGISGRHLGHMTLGRSLRAASFVWGSTMFTAQLFVTGPQRSGTTFLAHALSYDFGLPHIDEEDFQTFDFGMFERISHRMESWVAQAPALFHCLDRLHGARPDAIPVVVRRSIDEIVASQNRIGWHREEDIERRNLHIAETDRRPIAEIKYEIWDTCKGIFPKVREVDFDQLASHPLYKTQRAEFTAKRWQ